MNDDLVLLPERLSRAAQLAAVKALAPLGHRQELSTLTHAGIRAEAVLRRSVSQARGAVWARYDLARRTDLLVLREQVRALERRVQELEASRA